MYMAQYPGPLTWLQEYYTTELQALDVGPKQEHKMHYGICAKGLLLMQLKNQKVIVFWKFFKKKLYNHFFCLCL